jgi:septal ring factor EnvC (AmiA/AmiB activator)
MSFEFWWFVISGTLLLATLVVKVFTVSYLAELGREIQLIEHKKYKTLKELHRAKSKKDIANANLMVTKKERDKLKRRILGMEKEMEKITKDISDREEGRSSNEVEK